jgi:phosphatidylglycerophosphate synthase
LPSRAFIQGSNQNMIFMRIFGIVMLVLSWKPVFSPRVAFYKRSWVPVSLGSKLATAVAVTAFCVATFGVRPLLCAGLSAGCVLLGLWYSKRDRWEYEKQTGRLSFRPTGEQERSAFFAIDAVLFVLFLSFAIRDQIWRPVTQEQRIVQHLDWGFVAFTGITALLLYWKRSRSNASEN